MPHHSLDRYAYDLDTAAQVVSVSRRTLYRAIRAGDLTVTKIGRRTLVTAAALSEWLDKHTATLSAA
jgi:excisionase family DNA binding protein